MDDEEKMLYYLTRRMQTLADQKLQVRDQFSRCVFDIQAAPLESALEAMHTHQLPAVYVVSAMLILRNEIDSFIDIAQKLNIEHNAI
jgi:hypothetical protein